MFTSVTSRWVSLIKTNEGSESLDGVNVSTFNILTNQSILDTWLLQINMQHKDDKQGW